MYPFLLYYCIYFIFLQQNAEDLLKEFGSIPKILRTRTTQKSIMEIKGLGRLKAQTILSLREPY